MSQAAGDTCPRCRSAALRLVQPECPACHGSGLPPASERTFRAVCFICSGSGQGRRRLECPACGWWAPA